MFSQEFIIMTGQCRGVSVSLPLKGHHSKLFIYISIDIEKGLLHSTIDTTLSILRERSLSSNLLLTLQLILFSLVELFCLLR